MNIDAAKAVLDGRYVTISIDDDDPTLVPVRVIAVLDIDGDEIKVVRETTDGRGLKVDTLQADRDVFYPTLAMAQIEANELNNVADEPVKPAA